jgi:hypothetical protein
LVQWLSLPTLRIVTNFREHCMHRRKYNRRYYRISPICVGVDRESYDADNLVKAASTGVVYSSQSPTAGYDTYLSRCHSPGGGG